MDVIYVNPSNLKVVQEQANNIALVLGYFDGVHVGHQQVIKRAAQIAHNKKLKLGILSFSIHPKTILQKKSTMRLLEPLEQRIEKFKSLGVDVFFVLEFTKAVSEIQAVDFIKDYVIGLKAKHVICGFDYKYGYKAQGNCNTLKDHIDLDMEITVIEEEQHKNLKISSTLIRAYIQENRFEEIPNLLGHHYKFQYCPVKGILPNYIAPSSGEYKVKIESRIGLEETYLQVDQHRRLKFRDIHFIKKELITVHILEKINSKL